MKKFALLSIAALGFGCFAATAGAQRYHDRYDDRASVAVPGARVAVEVGRRDDRLGYEIDRLNREIDRLRWDIRRAGGGGLRLRGRFVRLEQRTAYVTGLYRRNAAPHWELRRRVAELRDEAYTLSRFVRGRHIGLPGWR